MSLTKSFTQGGQTQLHNFRMIRQVAGTTFLASLIIGIGVTSYLIWKNQTVNDIILFVWYQWAKLRPSIPFLKPNALTKINIVLPNGSRGIFTCWDMLYDFKISSYARWLESSIIESFYSGLYALFGSFSVISGFWIWMGKRRQETKILKGTEIVSSKNLTNLIKKTGVSSIKITDVPLPKNAEKEHLMICGTTGSGKTNAINSILQQVRELRQKALIIDTTGGYIERFYDEKQDYILNPFDDRSESWDLWKECREEYDYLEFAESFIPQTLSDPFWSNASTQLLSAVALQMASDPNRSLEKLLDFLLVMPFKEVFHHLKGSPAASYVDPNSEKTASSIRSSMASSLWSFKYLTQNGTPFSIRYWCQNDMEKGWLFIAATPSQRETLKPLMSAWLSIAIKSLMEVQENHNYRVWFVVDELASLNKIPILKQGLAEVRKYGGCFVIGFQNIHQLYAIYRQDDAQTLISLMGTKLVFRSENAEATYLSKVFGEQEILQQSGSISFGAHQMRDGVSLSDQQKTKPIISPTDIMTLNPLEAYIKFPRRLPLSKVTFPITKTTIQSAAFIRNSETKSQADNILNFNPVIEESNHFDLSDNVKFEGREREVG